MTRRGTVHRPIDARVRPARERAPAEAAEPARERATGSPATHRPVQRRRLDAARREAPDAFGTYTVRGRDVVLKMGSRQETIVATRVAGGVLEIRGTKFKRGITDKLPK